MKARRKIHAARPAYRPTDGPFEKGYAVAICWLQLLRLCTAVFEAPAAAVEDNVLMAVLVLHFFVDW